MKSKVTFLPPAPQEEHFQEYSFDENLGEAPLLQKSQGGSQDLGGPKGWKQFMEFLNKAAKCLQ